MKYIFIRENRGSFPVSLLCQTLGVGKSGFYTWLNRPVSPRSLENRRLLMEIKVVHKKSRKTYGSPRVHADLNETGHVCSKHRVARLMRENGIVSKHKKMFNVTTNSNHSYPIAENLLQRQFDVSEPGLAFPPKTDPCVVLGFGSKTLCLGGVNGQENVFTRADN